jgi:tripartite-type tricarboxylate transporter receptor subunit TctC
LARRRSSWYEMRSSNDAASVVAIASFDHRSFANRYLRSALVAHARPDGYTILLAGTSQYVTEAPPQEPAQFDRIKDLEPISNVAVYTLAIVVHPAVPPHTLKEFVDYAKANPGKVSYGTAGTGSTNHLIGELLKNTGGNPRAHPCA